MDDISPTARALLTLEMISARPGISAERLADRLGVSDRAARRYVAILREAGVPIESVRGPYGGYRVGRGVRLAPLMFTATEALALVMAVIEAHGRPDPERTDDPVSSAVGKLVRVLPEAVARPFEAVRGVSARRTDPDPPDPETTAALVQASADLRRVRVGYRPGSGAAQEVREMEVDPWAVAVRHGRWYVVCWSHGVAARRMLRVDRIVSLVQLDATFEPPPDLDPLAELEDQLSQGWRFACEVDIDAPVEQVRWWIPRTLGRLEPLDQQRCRLVGSTQELTWYVAELADLRAPFRVVGGPELIAEVGRLTDRLRAAVR